MPDTDGIEHWLRVTVDPVEDASGRVAHTVGKIEVIDEERREKDQLVARAERDSLTGLLNSETTRLRIGQQLDALAGGERGALLVVDVDCFKDVNDTHGHLVGDLVLADIARILRENFRIGDVVGRLGGDEFMVYLDRVGSTDVAAGSARGLGPRGRRFESCHLDQNKSRRFVRVYGFFFCKYTLAYFLCKSCTKSLYTSEFAFFSASIVPASG